jgi:hypothetical protein
MHAVYEPTLILGVRAIIQLDLWLHRRVRASEREPTVSDSTQCDDMQLVMTSHLDLRSAPSLMEEAGVPVVAALRVALMLPRGALHLKANILRRRTFK